jgi:capsular polysaccharide biosynthesis protein
VVLVESYRALGRHKVLIFAGSVLCVLAALLLTARAEKVYEATAVVRIEPSGTTDANARFEAAQHLTRSYAEIYVRGALIPEMQRVLGRPVIRTEDLKASQVKDLDLLAVTGRSTDPAQAARIANAGTVAMEGFSPRERIVILTAATVPTAPASPNVLFNLVLAVVLGVTLNVALALLVDALRQPLPDADGIEREFDLPVIAQIPRLRFAPHDARPAGHEAPSSEAIPRRTIASRDQAGG